MKPERKTEQHRKRGSDAESEGAGSVTGKAESFKNTSEAAAIQKPNGKDAQDSCPGFVDAFDKIEWIRSMEPSVPVKQVKNFVRIGRSGQNQNRNCRDDPGTAEHAGMLLEEKLGDQIHVTIGAVGKAGTIFSAALR